MKVPKGPSQPTILTWEWPVGDVNEAAQAVSISVMATVATTAILRTVHSYSTGAGRRDVGVTVGDGRWNRSRSYPRGSFSVLTPPRR